MKNTLKTIVLLMIGFTVLGMTGCETLGWANPFSPGNQIYTWGQAAWNEGNEAEAFRFFSKAVYEDPEHYPSIKFFIENYTDGMAKIEAKIAQYEASAHVADWVELEELYWNLSQFYGNLDGFGDPMVLSLNDQTVSMPYRDLTEIRDGLDARAYAVGIQEGLDMLAAEDWKAANDAFEITVDEFAVEKDDTKFEISNYMADALEGFLAGITLEELESAGELLDYGIDFSETERLLVLGEEIGTAGINLIFTESDRLAQRGTEDSLKEALDLAKVGYQYTNDRSLVDAKINTYAGSLAGIYNRKVAAAERAYDGTEAGVAPVYEAYGDLYQWVNESYPDLADDYSDIGEQIAAFNDREIKRFYVVFDPEFSTDARNDFCTSLDNAVAGMTNDFYWFGTSDEKNQMNSWRSEYGLTHVGVDDGTTAFMEVMGDYNDRLKAMDTMSRLTEATALGLDYFAVVTADPGRESAEIVYTTQTKSLTYYIQDGEVKNDSSMLDTLAGMHFVNAEATEEYCQENDIQWVRDNEYYERYAQAVTTLPVRYSIVIFDVASGSRVYSGTVDGEAVSGSRTHLIDVDDINMWHYTSLEGDNRRDVPEPVSVSAKAIDTALLSNLNFNRIAMDLVR